MHRSTAVVSQHPITFQTHPSAPLPRCLRVPRLQSHRCLLQDTTAVSVPKGAAGPGEGDSQQGLGSGWHWELGRPPREKAGSERPTPTSALVLNRASFGIFTMHSRIFHGCRQAFLISCISSPLILNSNY